MYIKKKKKTLVLISKKPPSHSATEAECQGGRDREKARQKPCPAGAEPLYTPPSASDPSMPYKVSHLPSRDILLAHLEVKEHSKGA